MVMVSRCQLSAEYYNATLYVIQAEDQFISALDHQQSALNLNAMDLRQTLGRMVLNHTNMNETGRNSGFCLIHVGMRARLTQTTERGVIIIDATGKVVGIEPDEQEPKCHFELKYLAGHPVVVLRYMPRAVYFEQDEVEDAVIDASSLIDPKACAAHVAEGACRYGSDCEFYDHIVAVTPHKNRRAWTLEKKLPTGEVVKVKVLLTFS